MSAHDATGPRGEGPRELALRALSSAEADEGLVGLPAVLQRLCRAATQALALVGASVHLLNVTDAGGVLASSDPNAQRIGEAAFTVGEGPSIDAFEHARPVLAPYLLEEGRRLWPGYVEAVCNHGVRACFALPLHVGAVRLGVLELYAGRPGALRPDQISLGLTFADLATETLLDATPRATAGAVNAGIADALDRNGEIYQAQGMVTVDLGVTLAEALALMRAHAFARGLSLVDVAREVIAGARLPLAGAPSAPDEP